MSNATPQPTFTLCMPDGRYIKLPAPGIRHYRAVGDRFPRFEIEGRRYGAESASEFPFLLDDEGPSVFFRLVALEPPPN